MKYSTAFIIILFLCSCTKEKQKKNDFRDKYTGSIKAKRNGKNVDLKLAIHYDSIGVRDHFSFAFIELDGDRLLDRFWLRNIPLSGSDTFIHEEDWSVFPPNPEIRKLSYLGYNGSFDKGENDYETIGFFMAKDLKTKLTVLEFDRNANVMKGTFQIAVRREVAAGSGLLDSVIYRDGTFVANMLTYEAFTE